MNTTHINLANQDQAVFATNAALNKSIDCTANSTARVAGSIVIGGITTFGLFVLMHQLTKVDGEMVVAIPPVVFETSIFQEKEEKHTPKIRMEPKPPAVIQPKVNRDDLPISITPTDGFDNRIIVDIPTTKIKTDVSNMNMQSEARPIVRINPEYPPVAARDGLEGWVELRFSINTDGGVMNVEVVNSEPKRVFDKAAKRALQRWKYKAKIEQGKAIVQHGLSVMLDFKMSQ